MEKTINKTIKDLKIIKNIIKSTNPNMINPLQIQINQLNQLIKGKTWKK